MTQPPRVAVRKRPMKGWQLIATVGGSGQSVISAQVLAFKARDPSRIHRLGQRPVPRSARGQ